MKMWLKGILGQSNTEAINLKFETIKMNEIKEFLLWNGAGGRIHIQQHLIHDSIFIILYGELPFVKQLGALPLHGAVSHTFTSLSFPAQCKPSLDGAGFVHVLSRDCEPGPQEVLQTLNSLH